MKKVVLKMLMGGMLFVAALAVSCKTGDMQDQQQEQQENQETQNTGTEDSKTDESKNDESKNEESKQDEQQTEDITPIIPSHEEECEWEKTFGGYTEGMVDVLDREVKFYSSGNGKYGYWYNTTARLSVKPENKIEIVVRTMEDSEFPEYKYESKDIVYKDCVDNLEGEYVDVSIDGSTGSEWHYSCDEWGNYSRINSDNPEAYEHAPFEKVIYYYDYDEETGTYVRSENGDYVKQIPPKDSQLHLYTNEENGWVGCCFKDVTSSDGFNWTWGNETDTVTCIGLKRSSLEQTITINLNEEEAEKINKYGLLMNGYGLYITQIRVPGRVYNYKTLEAQYLMKREERTDFLEDYRQKTGWTEPFVVITTKDAQSVVTRNYYDSIIDIVNVDEDFALTAKKGQVKVRGNSSADIDNPGSSKPIRIKFDKKHNMMGLHQGKKYKSWVMLNTNGGTDYMGFNLANEIYKTSDEFEPGKLPYFASDGIFVHLFINEKYEGMRLLCEQSQINSGRVDVTEYDEDDPKRNDVKTGYMIELDNYSWALNDNGDGWKDDEGWHFAVSYKDLEGNEIPFTDVNNVTYTIKVDNSYQPTWGDGFKIKNDIYNEDQVKFIRKVMNGIWTISYYAIEKGIYYEFDSNYDLVLSATKKSAKEACDAVIDLESLCNEIILEELVRDNDVGAGSLNMAIDFTKTPGQKYNKLTFECPWDFNWAYYKVGEHDYSDGFWLDNPERLQYFAGAWIPEAESGCKDRSNAWFMLYTKAPWFRDMLRIRWTEIGVTNLENRVKTVMEQTKNARKEGSFSMAGVESFLLDRIPYIQENLWVGKEAYLNPKTE